MKYYVIAGEASGDLHASNLIKGLRKFDLDAKVRGWGGDLMRYCSSLQGHGHHGFPDSLEKSGQD